jgi:ribosomal protein S18 acetylase RimI-like enzyme
MGFRPAMENDVDFLYGLHVATMKEYVDLIWGWDEAYQESLFRRNYVRTHIQIIMWDGRDIGMISVEEREEDVFLRAIEIHPDYQSQGIGTAIITRIIADGVDKMKPIFLQVLKGNPALKLYQRLGFAIVEETKTHYRMKTTNSN